MADEKIETFRGRVPSCRNCGKPLRPNYETVKEDYRDEGTKFARRYIEPADCHWSEPDDPTVPFHEEDFFGKGMQGGWDAKRRRYYRVERVYRVKSRRFKGTFGSRGDNFFCKTECGYRWAVKMLRNQYVDT